MAWNCIHVRSKLGSDHDRIYSDIDQMKSKMRREPDKYEYSRFLSEETGKLYVCIMLKDSATLNSKNEFIREVDRLINLTDEEVLGLTRNEDIEHDSFIKGWRSKLSNLSQEYK